MSHTLHQKARVASLTRSRTPDDPELLDARRGLCAAKIEDFIQRAVDQAPPLTDAQRERLALILRAGGGADGTAA